MEKKSVKGTRTEQNLLAAFAGESRYVHATLSLPRKLKRRVMSR